MNSNRSSMETKDRKVILSTLWIFAMFNYLYADVFSMFFDPGAQQEALQVTGGSQGIVLAFAILMETAIAMVLLSRVLKYRANRWANIIVGAIHTAAVFLSTFTGTSPTLYYLFFATVEIACTVFIIWYAWTWPNPESVPELRRGEGYIR